MLVKDSKGNSQSNFFILKEDLFFFFSFLFSPMIGNPSVSDIAELN